ncbi:hypothetical protein HR12_02965 [Microbacterium sp. SUBG005]|nr:hypothetical protein HR12_02965 [Microbacterium sp. SUBG005]
MWRVAVEYDGACTRRIRGSSLGTRIAGPRFVTAGWDHVRILSHHLRGDGAAAASLVRAALLRAGWRPGQ